MDERQGSPAGWTFEDFMLFACEDGLAAAAFAEWSGLCLGTPACFVLAPDACCAFLFRACAAIYWPHTSPACV